ncbi:hypothetical protein S7711_00060 [Stachybotrys chartarum IBT 7711]|uniref:Capsule polysaccharide biosynthesis protein n=1 Tax=Stachybotrys chartarum (strain CBS 109288 / IBT 7711) TaxID=1280523 RepID=A0A084B3B3_STACB|nr:hypothetical protein S7711_00060 [Stachybotrys chartarum IBT 7711]KFA52151.1 hypothetical protein S40293_00457 [Stachybotrys chartarum IBT 40293]KFA74595.1 hypothetical protein S40288_05832 [Stachybotrys chartarum IBT 40288]
MASASSKIGALILTVPPILVGTAGLAVYKTDWRALLRSVVSGENARNRVVVLLFLLLNLKSLPLSWTFRVFYSILKHHLIRKAPILGPRALFKPIISKTHAPLLEIDYNLHKTNSSYFADLDISRSHLVSYLCRQGTWAVSDNAKFKLVRDPATGDLIKGDFGVMLGAVECSFKREIGAYRGYETWSRVVSWDRKWLFIMTHFVPAGVAKPREWLDPRYQGLRTRGPKDANGDWEKKVFASAISKYVFKLGRFTIHPAIVLEASGLLPERPGGWISGEKQLGDESVDLGDVDLSIDGEWDWRRVEAQRRKGMETAGHFQALDSMHEAFDGGDYGVLGKFGPG